jgi:hypothetical protein
VAATLLELLPLERGLIALRSGGRFMCAQPDGRLDLTNIRCSTWECFLGSEDWCSVSPSIDINKTLRDLKETIDWNRISKYIVDARLRMKACAASTATKVLIYGYPQWSHGRVYYDLCKHLHEGTYISRALYPNHLIVPGEPHAGRRQVRAAARLLPEQGWPPGRWLNQHVEDLTRDISPEPVG